jgi:hypothetical protein
MKVGTLLQETEQCTWATPDRTIYSGPNAPGAKTPSKIETWPELTSMSNQGGFYVFFQKEKPKASFKTTISLLLAIPIIVLFYIASTLFWNDQYMD